MWVDIHDKSTQAAGCFFRLLAMGAILVGSTSNAADSPAAAGKKVVLGFPVVDGPKYNAEFQQYGRMKPVYCENNIEASFTDQMLFIDGKTTEAELYQAMKPFHVIALNTTSESIPAMTPGQRSNAAKVGTAITRYVSEGGGLLLFPQGRRYANSDDVNYWNMVLEPLGMKILYENVYDASRSFEAVLAGKERFWFAEDIRPHPITKEVERVGLSQNGSGPYPGVPAVEYSKEWQIVAHGSPEAKSYKTSLDNVVDYSRMGKYGSAAPLVAVRNVGKGRVVSLPVCFLYTGLNYGNPRWPHIVETKGNETKNQPSHTLKLMMNSYRWLAEPVLNNPEFGTFVNPPYKPTELPKTVDWDHLQFGKSAGGDPEYAYPDGQKPVLFPPTDGIRGVVGAHTVCSDGKATVDEYVKAAKAAGLAFIVFADSLEKMTPETLERLKSDCAKVSAGNDFYACPGVEFTDGIGNRWAAWGSKIVYPPKSFKEGDKEYVVWDGKNVRTWGYYRSLCMNSGCGLLDYKQLRANKANPQNLWWFYHYFPFAYDKDRLIADNVNEYLLGLRDLRWAAVMPFTRIMEAGEVGSAARTCTAIFRDLERARIALDNSLGTYTPAWEGLEQVTQGPVIATWTAINCQMEDDWKFTRGAQRARFQFVVHSDVGIREVKVHDADRGVIRRFAGHGAKELAREFEMVHDQQHWLVLEVTDTAGKRAISHYLFLFSYKTGLYRCGDNLNTLGGASLVWHPDRNQGVPWIAADAAGALVPGNFDFIGYDGWGGAPRVPGPMAGDLFEYNGLCLKDYPGSFYPGATPYSLGRNWDVRLGSHNIQIVSEKVDRLVEGYETRPTPAMATVTRTVGPLEYYQATHALYSLMSRWNGYVGWNYRRSQEGKKDYRGTLAWNEGEIRFLKDVTLRDPALAIARLGPAGFVETLNPDQRIGYMAVVKDADRGVRVGVVQRPEQPVKMEGRIKGGGYAVQLPSMAGYPALLVPEGNEYRYTVNLPSATGGRGVELFLGKDGQVIKKGTVMKYALCTAFFTDVMATNDLLEHTGSTLNLAGGSDGYPLTMKAGKLLDAVFFCTVEAKGNEAVMKLGPQNLIVDLPFRIRGLKDNGCVAVYSSHRPWFRFVPVCEGTTYFQEPIDRANEMWVGNVFVCDHEAVKVTAVVDGQTAGAKPFIEAHNPTEKEITATLSSPTHTPIFGGSSTSVKIPAGDSIRLRIDGKEFKAF